MKLPSLMEAALRGAPVPIATALDRLQDGTLPLSDFQVVRPSADGAQWELVARWHADGLDMPIRVHDVPMQQRLEKAHLEFLELAEDVGDDIRGCSHGVAVEALLDDTRPLDAFHAQTRVLAQVATDCAGVLDRSACVARTGGWLEATSGATVPPHPTSLYTVHAVGDGSEPRWLHTHGLLRCGRIELDLMDVPADDVGLMGEFLNAVCAIMLDSGVPDPGETFWAGHDLDLQWLPVERALRTAPRVRGTGGPDDRDDVHTTMRGVLVVTRPGRLWGTRTLHPTAHLPTLRNHPVLYVSAMETERRVHLAVDRFDRYRTLFERHHGHPAVTFLVKLGLATPDGGREHPWFLVHEIAATTLDATCVNQPHQIPDLHEGDRGMHDLALMTDFAILGPWGEGSPERIDDVETILGDDAVMSKLATLLSDA